MAFHDPTLTVKVFSPPVPLNGVNPKSTYGQMDTPSVFWRMPRKLYWFTKSRPPVTTTTGALVAVTATPGSCAQAGDAVSAAATTVTDTPKHTARMKDM